VAYPRVSAAMGQAITALIVPAVSRDGCDDEQRGEFVESERFTGFPSVAGQTEGQCSLIVVVGRGSTRAAATSVQVRVKFRSHRCR
jgi:hypothetical protein